MKELIIKCYEESDGIVPFHQFPKDGMNIPIVGELVRCKDCKYFTRDSITGVTIPGTEYCIFTMNNRIEENDYCSRAERKKE